jgi:hypothetical protein
LAANRIVAFIALLGPLPRAEYKRRRLIHDRSIRAKNQRASTFTHSGHNMPYKTQTPAQSSQQLYFCGKCGGVNTKACNHGH